MPKRWFWVVPKVVYATVRNDADQCFLAMWWWVVLLHTSSLALLFVQRFDAEACGSFDLSSMLFWWVGLVRQPVGHVHRRSYALAAPSARSVLGDLGLVRLMTLG